MYQFLSLCNKSQIQQLKITPFYQLTFLQVKSLSTAQVGFLQRVSARLKSRCWVDCILLWSLDPTPSSCVCDRIQFIEIVRLKFLACCHPGTVSDLRGCLYSSLYDPLHLQAGTELSPFHQIPLTLQVSLEKLHFFSKVTRSGGLSYPG